MNLAAPPTPEAKCLWQNLIEESNLQAICDSLGTSADEPDSELHIASQRKCDM